MSKRTRTESNEDDNNGNKENAAVNVHECGVCLEEYDSKERKPKFLTCCGHTYCATCVSGIAKQQNNKLQVR